jgi:outer membrane protein TolC
LQQQLVLAARSDTVAQRRFEVAKNRYLIGKIDITNLQLAQNEKDNARTVYFSTLKSYYVSYFRLRRSTLYDFRESRVLRVREEE